jgi:hypothetical protein
MSVILELWRLGQEDHELEASLGYIVRLCLKKTKRLWLYVRGFTYSLSDLFHWLICLFLLIPWGLVYCRFEDSYYNILPLFLSLRIVLTFYSILCFHSNLRQIFYFCEDYHCFGRSCILSADCFG